MTDRLQSLRGRRSGRLRRALRAPRGGLPGACSLHASDAGAAAAAAPALPAPAVAAPAAATSLATLLTRHILRDGEIILLVLKPSLWTILFGTLPAIGVALIVMISTGLWAHAHIHIAVEAGLMLIACRAAWAVLGWTGKLYLLTDRRVIRIWGVFNPQIHDVPLRRVARTRLVAGSLERLWRLGSMEIIPDCDRWPWSVWQTVPKPRQVHETICRAVARAKQGGWLNMAS